MDTEGRGGGKGYPTMRHPILGRAFSDHAGRIARSILLTCSEANPWQTGYCAKRGGGELSLIGVAEAMLEVRDGRG